MTNRWQVPVLMYHHVHPSIDRYTNTPPEQFARQMSWITARYSFWTAQQALDAWRRGESAEGHVVLTIDDGYEDASQDLRAILRRHGILATFFVIPRYVGGANTWNAQCGYRCRHLTWEQVASLAAEGHEIASHGMSHRPLDAISYAEASEEMRIARDLIRMQTGVCPTSFAYPYGISNDRVATLAAQFYEVAFSTVKSTQRDWNTARQAIRRIYIPQSANEPEVLALIEQEACA